MVSSNRTSLDFACELDFSEILSNPILDIAARFWEKDRYEAFKVCYRSMRVIDDIVDERKATGATIKPAEAALIKASMYQWLEAVGSNSPWDSFQHEFVATIKKFSVPLWPWERLAEAMVYDLNHDGFASFRTFIRYARGAAVAPASVFMHLCGVTPESDSYSPPEYDIRKAARPLALFSYLVHIIRDFQKDQLSNLNYFADDLISLHGLKRSDLHEIAKTAQPTDSFRELIKQYVTFCEFYRGKAREAIDRTKPLLQPRYQLSREIIYNLYSQIFERIDPDKGGFTAEELNPSEEQVKARVEETVKRFR